MSNAALKHYMKNCPKQQYHVLQHAKRNQKEKRNEKAKRNAE